MTKKRILLIVVLLLFIIIFIKVFEKDDWEINEALLKQEVLNISESVVSINLSNVTPFEWDEMYSFDPYTPKEMIYETVGYKWGRISETVSEGMDQVVFMKDEKVVCYLYGYPENNRYGISFISEDSKDLTSYSLLKRADDVTFEVDRSDGIIYLIKEE